MNRLAKINWNKEKHLGVRTLLILMLGISIINLLSDYFISEFQLEPRSSEILDSFLILLLTFPLLYLLVFIPFRNNTIRLRQTIDDLIIAKEKAEENEVNLRAIFDNSLDALSVSKEGYTVMVNNAFMNLYGVTDNNEVIGKYFLEHTHPSQQKQIEQNIQKRAKGEYVPDFYESIGVRKDGEAFPFEIKVGQYLVKNEKYSLSIIRDITERKKAELELIKAKEKAEESEFFLKESQKAGLIGSYKTDFISGYWKSSETLDFIFGIDDNYDRSVKGWLDLVHPDDKEMMNNYLVKEVIENHTKFDKEYRINRINENAVRWVHGYGKVNTNDEGKVISLIGTIQDITERKEAEMAIKNEQLLLRTVIDNIPDSIYIKDLNCRKTLVNSTEMRFTGVRSESEIIGKDDFDLFPNELAEKFFVDDQTVLLSALPVLNREEFLFDENQEKRWLLTSKIPLKGANHQIIGLLGIGRDITEIKHTEIELKKAKEKAEENDRLKSAFLANMSHEIRTPMNGILGFADLLKEPMLSCEEQEEYISLIELSGKRMLSIINDIVDISKIESGQMTVNISESNINEQIEYIYTFFKPEIEQKRMQLFLNNGLLSKESVIKTDREKIFAILTNLVKNAIKYSDFGTIEFGYTLHYTGEKAELEFFVKDQGIGIPLDRQEAIFERFIQADSGNKRAYQGAGLGLAITKKYVEMLGGKIWVESEPGQGSIFYFTLPYITPEDNKVAQQNLPNPYSVDSPDLKVKILIAEDDYTSEKLICQLLKKNSRELLNVQTGIEAVEAVFKNPDIDIILMDIQMPEMDGYEATRQIRQFNKNIIIIAQTAFGLSGDREKAIEAGCNDYLVKPINKDNLFALIQKYA